MLTRFVAITSLLTLLPFSRGFGQFVPCDAHTERNIWFLDRIRRTVGPKDSEPVNRHLMRLPLLPPDSVRLVADSAACVLGREAYLKALPPDQRSLLPMVVQAGAFYVTGDDTNLAGEFARGITFDSRFRLVSWFGF